MTDTTTDMTGEQFAQGLKALGWKQVQFADRAGVGAVTVNRWIHGRLAVPAWAAAHLRLLLASAEEKKRHADFLDLMNYLVLRALRWLERAERMRIMGRYESVTESIHAASATLAELLESAGFDPGADPQDFFDAVLATTMAKLNATQEGNDE